MNKLLANQSVAMHVYKISRFMHAGLIGKQ